MQESSRSQPRADIRALDQLYFEGHKSPGLRYWYRALQLPFLPLSTQLSHNREQHARPGVELVSTTDRVRQVGCQKHA